MRDRTGWLGISASFEVAAPAYRWTISPPSERECTANASDDTWEPARGIAEPAMCAVAASTSPIAANQT